MLSAARDDLVDHPLKMRMMLSHGAPRTIQLVQVHTSRSAGVGAGVMSWRSS